MHIIISSSSISSSISIMVIVLTYLLTGSSTDYQSVVYYCILRYKDKVNCNLIALQISRYKIELEKLT